MKLKIGITLLFAVVFSFVGISQENQDDTGNQTSLMFKKQVTSPLSIQGNEYSFGMNGNLVPSYFLELKMASQNRFIWNSEIEGVAQKTGIVLLCQKCYLTNYSLKHKAVVRL